MRVEMTVGYGPSRVNAVVSVRTSAPLDCPAARGMH